MNGASGQTGRWEKQSPRLCGSYIGFICSPFDHIMERMEDQGGLGWRALLQLANARICVVFGLPSGITQHALFNGPFNYVQWLFRGRKIWFIHP